MTASAAIKILAGLVVLAVIAPILVCLVQALFIPLLVLGVLAIVARLVWFYTDRW
jgi:hypothetical protein